MTPSRAPPRAAKAPGPAMGSAGAGASRSAHPNELRRRRRPGLPLVAVAALPSRPAPFPPFVPPPRSNQGAAMTHGAGARDAPAGPGACTRPHHDLLRRDVGATSCLVIGPVARLIAQPVRYFCAATADYCRTTGTSSLPSPAGRGRDDAGASSARKRARRRGAGPFLKPFRLLALSASGDAAGRGPSSWPDPSGPAHSSAQPSDNRPAGPTFRGILPASYRTACADDASAT